ncbi:MAG: hypothetical protein GX628_07330 [Clostridiales bacterium]|nr:hypothetical protein [Clostridiales bacterium]
MVKIVKRNIKILTAVKLILRFWWFLLIAGVITFVGTYYLTEHSKTLMYTSYGTMFIRNREVETISSTGYSYDPNASRTLLTTYMKVLKSKRVLNDISESLDNKYPASYISSVLGLGSAGSTEIMELVVRTSDPNRSAEILNAVMDVAPGALTEIVKVGVAEVIDYAEPASYPDNPKSFNTSIRNALIAMIAVGVFIIFVYLVDGRVKGTEDIKENYSVPVLGEIPTFNLKSGDNYQSYYERKQQ